MEFPSANGLVLPIKNTIRLPNGNYGKANANKEAMFENARARSFPFGIN